MTSLVRHLHDFVKDVELTEAEWETAITFLTDTGQTCTPTRQEFILLSDVLGVSMLVETINHRPVARPPSPRSWVRSTWSPPRSEDSGRHRPGRQGHAVLVSGQVTGPDGEPVAGATVDVWQTNEDGFYDVQQPDVQPAGTCGGSSPPTTTAGSGSGRWLPRYYPIPDDGPVGRLLAATNRHPNRPRTCTSSPQPRASDP